MKKLLGLLILLLIFGLVSCQRKPLAPADSPEAYVGIWKITDAQGQKYYMTLRADGSGVTTRGEGEFGTWKIIGEHLELRWIPKNLQIQFSSGSVQFKGIDSSGKPASEKFTAEKVEKIPD